MADQSGPAIAHEAVITRGAYISNHYTKRSIPVKILKTLVLRFARHAVVTPFDQIHLRLSCPPFICVKFKKQM